MIQKQAQQAEGAETQRARDALRHLTQEQTARRRAAPKTIFKLWLSPNAGRTRGPAESDLGPAYV